MARWVLIVGAWYLGWSLVTIIAYGLDKRAAVRGGWRIREHTLHLMAWLGGFPGSLLAMQVFAHKRQKPGFVAVTAAGVLLHGAGWIGVAFWRGWFELE